MASIYYIAKLHGLQAIVLSNWLLIEPTKPNYNDEYKNINKIVCVGFIPKYKCIICEKMFAVFISLRKVLFI